MENNEIIRNIEQTIYGKLFMENKQIQVTTKTGWQSDVCHFICEARQPAGILVSKKEENNTNEYFVPFDAIDHVKIFN